MVGESDFKKFAKSVGTEYGSEKMFATRNPCCIRYFGCPMPQKKKEKKRKKEKESKKRPRGVNMETKPSKNMPF